jgi:hypothetical protein
MCVYIICVYKYVFMYLCDRLSQQSTWDGNSAFNTEPRQDTFSGVSDRVPRLLCMGLWTLNAPAVARSAGGMECNRCETRRSSWSTLLRRQLIPLFCSIHDALDRVVCEFFPLMPSYTGVSAICDDLQVKSDPQLALPFSEVVQRKFMESGRSLNLKKCRILVHPDSAHLVVWPPRWFPASALQSPLRPAQTAWSAHRHRAVSGIFCRAQSVKGYHPRLLGWCFASASMSA